MSQHLFLMLFTFCAAITCLILAAMFNLMMIGEINRKKADNEQISYFWHNFVKDIKIWTEYRRLCPSGWLHIYLIVSSSLATCLLLLFGWQAGFF